MFNHRKLKCYIMAVETAKAVPSLVRSWPYYLSDQFKRAFASIICNLAEGNGRQGQKDRKRFFNIAAASAKESASCIDIAYVYGYISSEACDYMQDRLLQITKMISRLP